MTDVFMPELGRVMAGPQRAPLPFELLQRLLAPFDFILTSGTKDKAAVQRVRQCVHEHILTCLRADFVGEADSLSPEEGALLAVVRGHEMDLAQHYFALGGAEKTAESRRALLYGLHREFKALDPANRPAYEEAAERKEPRQGKKRKQEQQDDKAEAEAMAEDSSAAGGGGKKRKASGDAEQQLRKRARQDNASPAEEAKGEEQQQGDGAAVCKKPSAATGKPKAKAKAEAKAKPQPQQQQQANAAGDGVEAAQEVAMDTSPDKPQPTPARPAAAPKRPSAVKAKAAAAPASIAPAPAPVPASASPAAMPAAPAAASSTNGAAAATAERAGTGTAPNTSAKKKVRFDGGIEVQEFSKQDRIRRKQDPKALLAKTPERSSIKKPSGSTPASATPKPLMRTPTWGRTADTSSTISVKGSVLQFL